MLMKTRPKIIKMSGASGNAKKYWETQITYDKKTQKNKNKTTQKNYKIKTKTFICGFISCLNVLCEQNLPVIKDITRQQTIQLGM